MHRRPTPWELDFPKSPNKIERTEEGLAASGAMRRFSITPCDLECMLCDETADPKALPLSLLEEITNDFSDQQKIGSGGFTVVYKGMLESRAVAVKRMSDALMDEKEFHREVECLMMVKHTNVVRFLGYCADTQGSMERYNGKFVMADVNQRLLCFEYLPKGSLDKYIADMSRGFPWRDCFQIIKGICHGLHYLHQKNIVHLDLKPANILLDDNWVPKITDFGISRHFDEMQSRIITKIAGTLGYLAPESFNHTGVTYRHSYRLDIYSLGVVIIEVLTGEKGYHDVDNVVESWRNKVEKSDSRIELKKVRVCAEIGMECIDSNPAKRPDAQKIINVLNEYIETDMITSQQINPDMLSDPMRALWLSYQELNSDIKQCIEYCSIFPRGSILSKEKLVCQWIVQEYVKTSCETEDMEAVAEGYIQALVSCSFLQPGKSRFEGCHLTDCFTFHTELHNLLDKVTGNEYFRIENETSHRGEGWQGHVPRDVQHLFIQKYDTELITNRILKLENLRTLLVDIVPDDAIVEKEVIESICKRLLKLRVLAVGFREGRCSLVQPNNMLSVPESISQLKHLHYLAFRTNIGCKVILPATINELQHIVLLDFGQGYIEEFNFGNHVNLRYLLCGNRIQQLRYIGGLISLETLGVFEVSNKQGYGVKQLRDLNNLHGSLVICDLGNVESKEEALEANLAAKERLTKLELSWYRGAYKRCSPEVEAEVLEGLCPPVGLESLSIKCYQGSRYPNWMVDKQNSGLQELHFWYCIQPGPAPQLVEAFPNLRVLELWNCSWDALPGNMEHLTSLKELTVSSCLNIRSLPTLPQSLEGLRLVHCDYEFMESCRRVGDPNWQKIEHIREKRFC